MSARRHFREGRTRPFVPGFRWSLIAGPRQAQPGVPRYPRHFSYQGETKDLRKSGVYEGEIKDLAEKDDAEMPTER